MTIKTEKNHTASRPHEEKSALRQALPQILAVCVKNVLLLGFGMTLGFPTILIPSLSGNGSEEQISLDSEAISWIGSINLICVPVGCLMSGAITQPLGRKRAMQLVNIPFLTAWLLFHFSTDAWHVFLALCITGISGGLLEAPTLTYVAEITEPSLRGILASTSGIAVLFGILIQFFLGSLLNWRTIALLSCIAPLMSIILLFFVPESPHWLVSKKHYSEAQKSLAWLRGWTEIEKIQEEFDELCEAQAKCDGEKEANKGKTCPNLSLYLQKNFIWPFCLVTFCFFLSQFSGVSPTQTYAVKIFTSFKTSFNEYFATIMIGIAEVLGSIFATCAIHYTGKRVLNFVSFLGCGLSFMLVATYAYLTDVTYIHLNSTVDQTLLNTTNMLSDEPDILVSNNWIPVTFIIGAELFGHIGIRHLPWILVGEVFTSETRANGSGVAASFNYLFSFTSNKIFLTLVSTLTLPGTYWFYSGISLVGFVVLYFVLPETEGKSLFEITEHFSNNSKLGNKVSRGKKQKTNGQVNKGFSQCGTSTSEDVESHL